MPAAGGEPTRLTFDDTFAGRPAWTADGRELVFSSDRGGGIPYLWRIAVSGGRPERVAGVGLNASSPAISRRGDRLAYTQVLADDNIWRFEVESSTATGKPPKRLISSTLSDNSPNYSPDGERIVFASLRSGSWEIWVCEADGSNPVQLTHFGRGTTGTPRWSPDGREVAFDARAEGKVRHLCRRRGRWPAAPPDYGACRECDAELFEGRALRLLRLLPQRELADLEGARGRGRGGAGDEGGRLRRV